LYDTFIGNSERIAVGGGRWGIRGEGMMRTRMKKKSDGALFIYESSPKPSPLF